jgi:ABC-type hemin transport system substrate-binding protein
LCVRAAATLAAAFWLFLLPACSRSSPSPPAPAAQRLVVLSPALAVTLRDLGLQDRIVGRHAYDLILPASIPVVGEQSAIDYEALLAANPTDVIIEWGSRPLPDRLLELARERSWNLRPCSTLTLDDIERGAAELGGALLPPERAEARDRLLERFRASLSGRADLSRAGRVLLLISTSPTCAALGPGSCHQQVLERIGIAPALDHGSPFMELDAEDVLRLAPDVIVLVAPRAPGTPEPRPPSWEDLAARLGALARLDIPAVKSRRVALIDDPLALLPATSLTDFADELRGAIEAWAGGSSPRPEASGTNEKRDPAKGPSR